jgi:hypothetical protein
MPHSAPKTFFTGFDCRGCGDQIPVFTGAPDESIPAKTRIHIMCPTCGYSGQYTASKAYRFASRSEAGLKRALKGGDVTLV